MESQKSAIGLDGNITAALGYPIGIIALILVFIEKDNKFVRFHAIQSLLWGVAIFVAMIALLIVGMILGFGSAMISESLAWVVGSVFFLLYFVCAIAGLGGMIYAAVKAFGNDLFKLPVVGNFAEKWNN